MANVEPLTRDALTEFEPYFVNIEQAMGFVPNSLLTMAHSPEILRGFSAMAAAVFGASGVSPALKQLVAFVASNASGCRYCQAHTSSSAVRLGVSPEKVAAVYDFETNPLFSEAESAALRLARDAAIVPNATTPEHFVAVREHFSEAQIVEIVAVISLFGWLNRWNDTMATRLEAEPLDLAAGTLAPHGWSVGKHGGA